MRLDRYLKVSMVIKRRVVAKELADAGMVLINNKIAKPNSEIKVGDTLKITMGSKTISGTVTSIDQKDYFKGNMFVYEEQGE